MMHLIWMLVYARRKPSISKKSRRPYNSVQSKYNLPTQIVRLSHSLSKQQGCELLSRVMETSYAPLSHRRRNRNLPSPRLPKSANLLIQLAFEGQQSCIVFWNTINWRHWFRLKKHLDCSICRTECIGNLGACPNGMTKEITHAGRQYNLSGIHQVTNLFRWILSMGLLGHPMPTSFSWRNSSDLCVHLQWPCGTTTESGR
jgi:hypothetical protein